jgi:hypothetical protein
MSQCSDNQSADPEAAAESAVVRYKSPDHDFQCLSVNDVKLNLDFLCQHVVKANGRLEIELGGECGTCVVLSKCELEALESALEIFVRAADESGLRDGIRAICKKIDVADE